MSAIVETINAAGRVFVGFSLPMLLQSGVLIGILFAVDRLLRRKVRAVFRYWMWMLVLVKLVLPVSLGSPISVGTWFGGTLTVPLQTVESGVVGEWQPQAEGLGMAERADSFALPKGYAPVRQAQGRPDDATQEPTGNVSVQPAEPVSPSVPMTTAMHDSSLTWQGLAFLAWATVAAALLLLLLQRALFVRGLTLRTDPASPELIALLEDCRRRMAVGRLIRVRVSPYATGPAVCGLVRPAILIPQGLASKLQAHELRAVLMHELAHVKRGDLWINVAQTLLQIVYFYNPLLWLANAVIRRVREQAVDETVLVALGDTADEYPQTLVNIARLALANRPALTLRLIGVVESKNALTARIKHILTHPIPKSAKLGLLGLIVVLLTAAVLLPMAKSIAPQASVVNNGPLDIRLVGICPDSSEDLYDAGGRKLDRRLGAGGVWTPSWGSDRQCRDFYFEIPNGPKQPFLMPSMRLTVAGTNFGLGGSSMSWRSSDANSINFGWSMTFDRTYPRMFHSFRWNSSIDQVDVTVEYYYGARRESLCTFTGPFTADRTVQADEGRPYSLIPKIVQTGSDRQFNFMTTQPFNSSGIAMAYDLEGRRHQLDIRGGRIDSQQGANIDYGNLGVPLDRIAMITVGEKPNEITFRNVNVHFRDHPQRTYAEFLDKMADRLGLTGLSPEQLQRVRIKTPEEAIKVIEVVRGEQNVRAVVEALKSAQFSRVPTPNAPQPFRISDADEATQEKIRRVATQWAGVAPVSQYGIQLGLLGQWPEFFDMAIKKLASVSDMNIDSVSYESAMREVAYLFVGVVHDLTPAQVQEVEQAVLTVRDGLICTLLIQCLARTDSQASVEARWELAQDDRPWIWWPALASWHSSEPQPTRRPIDERLSEAMSLRLSVVRDELKDEAVKARAAVLLRQVLTPEVSRMDSSTWRAAADRIVKNLDKVTATEIYIGYLRQLRAAMASSQGEHDGSFRINSVELAARVIRPLNAWYDRDFGGFGTEETRESSAKIRAAWASSISKFDTLIAEVVAWYDGQRKPAPLDSAFAGRVVDTAGQPIAGAQLSFIKQELYTAPQGDRVWRDTNIGMCRTDGEGHFKLLASMTDAHYTFEVNAVGFITRKPLFANRISYGRYQFRDEGTEANLIILQRPGAISGRVLGIKGAPPQNGKLDLRVHTPYSGMNDSRGVIIGADGRFTTENVPKGPGILSYVERRWIQNGQNSRVEFAGRCAVRILEADEGGYLTDLVLDLSKSVCSLEVTVLDSAGQPVKVMSFSPYARMPDGSYRDVFGTQEAASDGVYRFNGLPPGAWRIKVEDRQNASNTIDVQLSPQAVARYRITLNQNNGQNSVQGRTSMPAEPSLVRQEISGRVVDPNGKPVSGAQVG
jgi:beta-lactamase regulating signal transducer with metallopeptidase domain